MNISGIKARHRALLSWGAVGLLAGLCGFLAFLQNRWISEISQAERERLHLRLQADLNSLSREFNTEIADACFDLVPSSEEIEKSGKEQAYSERYLRSKQSHDGLFSRIALVLPVDGSLLLLHLNFDTARFARIDWPGAWEGMRGQLLAHLNGGGTGMLASTASTLIDLPRFGHPAATSQFGSQHLEQPREQEWLLVELNLDHIRSAVLPELLQRHLGEAMPNYRAEVVETAAPSKIIFSSSPERGGTRRAPDASVNLFYVDVRSLIGRSLQQPPSHFHPLLDEGASQGLWRLSVRDETGSLESAVRRARLQNLATSLGVLSLILATVVLLVRFTRGAQRLAEQQINFVAGVSHELRTPITVIRTAAFNLRGSLAANPEMVERHGILIQNESEKLTSLVEQVLRFASAKAGHVIRAREPVAVEDLIEQALRSSCAALAGPRLVIDKKFDAGLPLILADQLAMRHALQNLVDNALKYGMEGSDWIGISASTVGKNGTLAVEVRVADRGPGIPPDEQEHIFDTFFRGRQAVQDQVHGTGLGLNLVKKIIEAHGGTIHVESQSMKGTGFVVRIPAAPPEMQDELAHSFS